MSEFRIPRGQTMTLEKKDGDLKIGHNATVQAGESGKVTIIGSVFLEGKAYVNGDLECESLESEVFLSKTKEFSGFSQRARLDLTGRYVGKLEVKGNLTVHKLLNVTHSVKVNGALTADDIDVGGKIQADTIKCRRMRVGGRADIQNTFEASSVDVGGKVCAPGTVKIEDMRVGGEAEVGGGSIAGNIRVGGKFIANSTLEFGDLQVSGRGFLPANCRGRRISTFGKLSVCGNIQCNYMEVGGAVDIQGDCFADRVEVGGKFQVSGSLKITNKYEGFGVTDVAGNFESAQLRLSGKLSANKMLIKEEADISGKIEAKEGLKAELVTVRIGGRCEGALVAERVVVGKSSDVSYGACGIKWATKWATAGGIARVDDVYAKEAVIGPMCRAARIFADTVRLEQGSAVEQVTYTAEFKANIGAAVAQEPKKVTDLPKPPL